MKIFNKIYDELNKKYTCYLYHTPIMQTPCVIFGETRESYITHTKNYLAQVQECFTITYLTELKDMNDVLAAKRDFLNAIEAIQETSIQDINIVMNFNDDYELTKKPTCVMLFTIYTNTSRYAKDI